MTRVLANLWLHRFAMLTALATLGLVCLGGVVTSKGVGMSVPDWPTTYGYNMFFFPFSKWVGGIFYEHTHRLLASAVGLLTVVLALWLWVKEARPWLRWLGVLALIAVILQGVLGGLRVTKMKDELGIFHAALAQLFFVLVSAIALFSSPWWLNVERKPVTGRTVLTGLYWLGTGLIFFQLLLGAVMRHQHAGLAISDFPLAHDRLWPAMDPASIAGYNQDRLEVTAASPITAFQVGLQMVHRLVAIAILASVLWAASATKRRLGWHLPLTKLAQTWCALIFTQILLGAATIWTNKSADIATAHVAVGALSLMTGALLILVASRSLQEAPAAALAGVRPSPGAARPGRDLLTEPSTALDHAELAVAEDGHAPPNRSDNAKFSDTEQPDSLGRPA